MADGNKVTRIKASDDSKKKSSITKKSTEAKKSTTPKKVNAKKVRSKSMPAWLVSIGGAFAPIGRYFKGAWSELRQVRWPNRQATWGLTLAVILFSLFFLLLIVLLDSAFKALFEFIIT